MNDQADRSLLNALVVEDDNLNQRMIVGVLNMMGVSNVDVADDGAIGLNNVQSRPSPYDLIISDIDMPNMNGLEFVKSIRSTLSRTTLVMLTARTDTADFNEAKTLGVEYFFMKPITPQMLKIRLSAVLDVASKRRSG